MTTLWKALGSLFSRSEAISRLERRLDALEAAQSDFQDAVEQEAVRAARWADMSAQLRRFLGRLDAHAGKDREKSENGTQDPKQLAAILRSKFPHTGA